MATRSVATTDTINTFRTTFNSLGTDVGDLSSLLTSDKSSVIAAINEAIGGVNNFTIRDETSTTQTIQGGDILNFVGSGGISATVSATDTLSLSLDSTITGLTSLTSTTLTDGTATLTGGALSGLTSLNSAAITIDNVNVATQPFAIAQSIALG